jgi:xanthine dehydrogenase YagR molybdenum-binding subunit
MKFDKPETTNPIDQLKVVGQPIDRVDGPLKTTGQAPTPMNGTIPMRNWPTATWSAQASPRDASPRWICEPARAAPGVVTIVTAESVGELGKGSPNTAKLFGGPRSSTTIRRLPSWWPRPSNRRATRLRSCASTYAEATASSTSRRQGFGLRPTDSRREAHGEFDGAFAEAPVQLDETYTTPDQTHAMMEPHASMAAWDGDQADGLDLQPDDRLGVGRRRCHAQHSPENVRVDLALHRRRLRRRSCSCVPT